MSSLVTAQNAEELSTGARQLGVALTETQHEQLLGYLALLIKWNKAYNLTAVRNPDEMVSRHLLDSLSVMPFIENGPLLGAGVVNGMKSWFTVAFPEYWLFFLGALFIIVTLYLPKGVIGLLKKKADQ